MLNNGELERVFDLQQGEFSVICHEHRFPLAPAEYPRIRGHRLERLESALGGFPAQFQGKVRVRMR